MTFSFGWTRSVRRTTFFAKASYSDTESPCRARSAADKYMRVLARGSGTHAPRSRPVDPGDLSRGDHFVLQAVHLEGGVRDAESLPQPVLDRIDDASRFLDGRISRNRDVAREDGEVGGDGPDV